MKNFLAIAFIFSYSLAFSQSNDSEYVNQLHQKKFEWLISRQYDSLDVLLGDNLHYIHSNGWIQSKADVLNDSKSGKLQYFSVTIEESTVSYYSTTAIVIGKGIFKGIIDDKTNFDLHLLYTEVYVKKDEKWKLVSRQATKLKE